MGQADVLPPGTLLVYGPFEPRADSWETEHCLFCYTPFLAPRVVEASSRLRGKPGLLTAGYTTTREHFEGARSHWACQRCIEDFAAELGLRVEGGPEAS
jgi:hypothetical protein